MHRSRMLGALLSAIMVTAPMTSASLASVAAAVTSTPAQLKQQAIDDRSTLQAERRVYKRIVEDCIRRITAGEKITCPDINDTTAIRAFIHGTSSSSVQSGSGAIPVLTLQDISDGDLALLRRYRNIQQCPEGLLTGKQPGFYKFCLEFIKDKRPQTEKDRLLKRKITDRIRALSESHTSSAAATLQDRLESLPKGIRPDR
jgi:hypothetical protein